MSHLNFSAGSVPGSPSTSTYKTLSAGVAPPSLEGVQQQAVPGGELVWHYTTGINFIRIVESGYLKPATAGVPVYEKPAVWFSRNQFWEETANKGGTENGRRRTLSREETRQCGLGLVRFGVTREAAPHDWAEFKARSGIIRSHARGLVASARAAGADPNDWFVSFEPVPRDQWAAIDVWDEAKNCWARVADATGLWSNAVLAS
jgi:hypothetical protein